MVDRVTAIRCGLVLRTRSLQSACSLDNLKAGIEPNRRELEMQSLRMDKMTTEIEASKARQAKVTDTTNP